MSRRNTPWIVLSVTVFAVVLFVVGHRRYNRLYVQVPSVSRRCSSPLQPADGLSITEAMCLSDDEQAYLQRFSIDTTLHGYRCPPSQLQRVGKELDGGKWLCINQPMKMVYSLGSNLELSFEKSMSKGFKSTISTFDCTVSNYTGAVPSWLTFRPWCLGDRNEMRVINGKKVQFYTLAHIMSLLGHQEIGLLKMDIEGSEYEVVRTLKDTPRNALPRQIVFELHEMVWKYKSKYRIELWQTLHSLGYRLFQYEPNYKYGKNTAEFSILLP